jgi:hypothetical protein
MVQDGDGAEFYKSSKGFAVQITPEGSRKISTKKNNMSATLPKEIREQISGMFQNTISVPHAAMPNKTYFFSFADIAAAGGSK